MRFLIQCTDASSVSVDGKVVGEIGKGFTVLVGIADSDDFEIADKMIRKMCTLRVFKDENGKTNLSLQDVGGSLLLISQFTLYADCKSGNRPGFSKAGKPDMAERLFDYIVRKASEAVENVQKGIFGAHMIVSLQNNGPFTIFLDSDVLFAR